MPVRLRGALRHAARYALAVCPLLLVGASPPVFESVVPALTYTRFCSSSVTLQNLAGTPVTVEIEAHRSSGALVPLAGEPGIAIRLDPGERRALKLRIEDEDTGAWVKIREPLAPPRTSPAIAISATTECRAENQLRTAARIVAFPARDPWFSSDVSEMPGAVITLINAAPEPARASACYSAGNLFSVPDKTGPDLAPLCSATVDALIPPFGSRDFPVARADTRHFSLKTRGAAIVLQMLRPSPDDVHVFTVDSTIRFGDEVREKTQR